jgi:hypothetical protein
MNTWIWVGIWSVILIGTGVFYFQIFNTLQGKAKRLEGQLAILQKNLEKVQQDLAQEADFTPEPSAIETGEGHALANRFKVIEARSKAKEARQRRLIRGLKKLQQESE